MGTSEIIFVVLIGLIGVGVGMAIGVLISGVRPEKPESSSTPKSRTNMIAVTTLWQDRKTGNVYPELNDKIVRFPAELSPSQRERLTGQIETLLIWLKPTARINETPDSAQQTAHPTGEQDEDYAIPLAAPTATMPKFSPLDLVARAVQPDTRPIEKPPQSIAAQIDEILQDKLDGTTLENRGIRLMELPSKGMVILVGMDQYQDVEAVPDLEIRRLIQESVAEWEKKSTLE